MMVVDEWIGLFKEFDINNIWMLIGVSIVLICVMTSYIQLLHASKIEAILMNKTEEVKRFSFAYIIVFFVVGVLNYMFTIDVSTVIFNGIICLLTIVVYKALSFFKSHGITEKLYWWCEERKDLVIILTATPILISFVSAKLNINIISCIILGTLVEVVIVAIMFLNVGNIRSFVFLIMDDEKWYVYKRIDENRLLCGNKSDIDDSTKIRLLEIDYIIEKKICFEKESIKDKHV